MTAVFVFVEDGAAITLLTDGHVTVPPGMAQPAAASKVYRLPRFPAVIVTRGPQAVLQAFGDKAALMADTFDGLLDYARHEIAARIRPGGTLFAAFPHVDVILAGISEANGPCAFVATSNPTSGLPTFKIIEIPYFFAAPQPSADLVAAFTAADDKHAAMISMMDATAARDATVGEFAERTIITAAGVSSSIVKHYPPKPAKALERARPRRPAPDRTQRRLQAGTGALGEETVMIRKPRKPLSAVERSIRASWAARRHVSWNPGAVYEHAETADIVRAAGAPTYNCGRLSSNYENRDPIFATVFTNLLLGFGVSSPVAATFGPVLGSIAFSAVSYGGGLQLAPRL